MKLSAVKDVIQQKSTRTALQSMMMVLSMGGTASLLADHDNHEHAHTSAEAHVHGEAELNIVVEGEDVLVEFISPLENLLGFEHAPETAAQKQAYEDMEQQLTDYRALFTITNADCEQTEHQHETPFAEAHATHAEWHGEYHLRCDEFGNAASLVPQLFSTYPGVEKMSIQLISAQGQSQFIVTKSSDGIPLR